MKRKPAENQRECFYLFAAEEPPVRIWWHNQSGSCEFSAAAEKRRRRHQLQQQEQQERRRSGWDSGGQGWRRWMDNTHVHSAGCADHCWHHCSPRVGAGTGEWHVGFVWVGSMWDSESIDHGVESTCQNFVGPSGRHNDQCTLFGSSFRIGCPIPAAGTGRGPKAQPPSTTFLCCFYNPSVPGTDIQMGKKRWARSKTSDRTFLT